MKTRRRGPLKPHSAAKTLDIRRSPSSLTRLTSPVESVTLNSIPYISSRKVDRQGERSWHTGGTQRQLATARSEFFTAHFNRTDGSHPPSGSVYELLTDKNIDDLVRLGRLMGMADLLQLAHLDTFAIPPEAFALRKAEKLGCEMALASLSQSERWKDVDLATKAIESALILGLENIPKDRIEEALQSVPSNRILDLAKRILDSPWTDLHRLAQSLLMNALAPGIPGAKITPEIRSRRRSDERWLKESDLALDPIEKRKVDRYFPVSVSEDDQVKAIDDFVSLMAGPMYRYSVEEIRRYLVEKWNFLSPSFVSEQILPKVQCARNVDRYGPEPHFLFAVAVAKYMLGVHSGTTEEQVIAGLNRDPSLRMTSAWRGLGCVQNNAIFSQTDLEHLRTIYPFIPTWENGVKHDGDFVLGDVSDANRKPEHLSNLDFPHWKTWKSVSAAIEKLGSIPLTDPLMVNLELFYSAFHSLFDDVEIIANCGTFADSIPWMFSMMQNHQIHGNQVHRRSKHYANDGAAIDVLRRVFGMDVDVLEGDDVIRTWFLNTIQETARANTQEGGRPLVLHNEGVLQLWDEIEAFQNDHPNLKILGVSHTASDSNDAVANLNQPKVLVKLMGHDLTKRVDEAKRFELNFTSWLSSLMFSTTQPLREFQYRIRGAGWIGRCAARAASKLATNVVVEDIAIDQQEWAIKEGYQLADSHSNAARVVLISSTGRATCPNGADDFRQFRGADLLVLVSFGSGQREFDMDYLKKNAEQSRVVATYGNIPIVEYILRLTREDGVPDEKPLTVWAVGDGYVGNLAFLHPTPAAYAATTPLITYASMLEGLDELERGVTGIQPLKFLEMDRLDDEEESAQILAFGPLNTTDAEILHWSENRHFQMHDPLGRHSDWLQNFGVGRPYVQEFGTPEGVLTYVARRGR